MSDSPPPRSIPRRLARTLRDQDWSAAALEVCIVVLGIIIAFQVTEWGEEAELRSRVDVQLQALREDFLANRTQLHEVFESQQFAVQQQRELLEVIHGVRERPDDDLLAGLVFSAVTFHRFEPVLGAYDALVSAGDLRLIRDPQLRAALAEFAEMAETGWEDEEQIHDIRVRLFAFLGEHGDILSIVYPAWREEVNFPPSSMSMDLDALLSSPQFSSMVAPVAFGEAHVLRYYRLMGDRLDAVLVRLGVSP